MSACDIYIANPTCSIPPRLIAWFCSLSFETYLARMRSCMAAPSPENFEMRPSPVSRTRTRSKTGFEPRRAKFQGSDECLLVHTMLAYPCRTEFSWDRCRQTWCKQATVVLQVQYAPKYSRQTLVFRQS